MALVGAGGKTTTLRRLARELAADGCSVIATTTTHMWAHELASLGPTVMDRDDVGLAAGLRAALARGRFAGAARAPGQHGKVVGLPPATVDGLLREGLADHVLVEADGSRGRSFKAFAAHEPQVPAQTTTIIQVAGLDAIGKPVADAHVHRAGELASSQGLPLGSTLTAAGFAGGLRDQLRRLRAGANAARVITLLNKADDAETEALGLDVARRLSAAGDGSRMPCEGRGRPDAVLIACFKRGRFLQVWPEAPA